MRQCSHKLEEPTMVFGIIKAPENESNRQVIYWNKKEMPATIATATATPTIKHHT